MEWITTKLDNIEKILTTVFTVLVVAMAIKAFVEGKIIKVFLLAVLAGILGWFVFDPEGAINTFKGMWS